MLNNSKSDKQHVPHQGARTSQLFVGVDKLQTPTQPATEAPPTKHTHLHGVPALSSWPVPFEQHTFDGLGKGWACSV